MAKKNQQGSPQSLVYVEYMPNVTCYYCGKETNPSPGEMRWEGQTLIIRQTCPECEKTWEEYWKLDHLKAVNVDYDDTNITIYGDAEIPCAKCGQPIGYFICDSSDGREICSDCYDAEQDEAKRKQTTRQV